FGGIEGKITLKDLPKINLLKIPEIITGLLTQINSIPPYYKMYPGRDRTVPDKKGVLNPQFPKDY
ncbi:MAG: oleate hydratase, partial [Chloroflexi bacterium HGW-Chloroflexi-7]